MKNRKQWAALLAAVLVLVAILAITDNGSSVAEHPNLAKVTFVVS